MLGLLIHHQNANKMGLINKNDLKLEYSWTTRASDGPIDQDNLGSNVFDRRSGDDVLSLLNDYAESHGITDKNEAISTEFIIRERLPKDVHTKEDAIEWLSRYHTSEEVTAETEDRSR